MSIDAVNFTGKYQVNANQQLSNQETCLKRDALMGFWSAKSKDGEAIHKQLTDFYQGDVYKANKSAPLDITFNIPDSEDKNFEESMNLVGQKFNKIV
jgi:hypothetical protein